MIASSGLQPQTIFGLWAIVVRVVRVPKFSLITVTISLVGRLGHPTKMGTGLSKLESGLYAV